MRFANPVFAAIAGFAGSLLGGITGRPAPEPAPCVVAHELAHCPQPVCPAAICPQAVCPGAPPSCCPEVIVPACPACPSASGAGLWLWTLGGVSLAGAALLWWAARACSWWGNGRFAAAAEGGASVGLPGAAARASPQGASSPLALPGLLALSTPGPSSSGSGAVTPQSPDEGEVWRPRPSRR